jgi:serine/threonine-protein kinase
MPVTCVAQGPRNLDTKVAQPSAPHDESGLPLSIGVIPFANATGDAADDVLADGVSRELIATLEKIQGFGVASWQSSCAFRGSAAPLHSIACELGVDALLAGTLVRQGGVRHIEVALHEVSADATVWTDVLQWETESLSQNQETLARSILGQLRRIHPDTPRTASGADIDNEVRRASVGRSEDATAFQLYLQAIYFGERTTARDLSRAMELLHRSIAVDECFALAWAELSRVHRLQGEYGFVPIKVAFEQAAAAARRALSLAPDLAEAHVAIGTVLRDYEWNWSAAATALTRASRVAPGSASAASELAVLFQIDGRFDNAVRSIQRALELDPLSSRTWRQSGLIHFAAGHLAHAKVHFNHALELNPNVGLAHAFLALIFVCEGDPMQAVDIANTETHEMFRNLALSIAYWAMGDCDRSTNVLHAQIEGFAATAAYQIAEACAFRGDRDAAFLWLNRAAEQRDPGMTHAPTDIFLRGLHDDARWASLVRLLHANDVSPIPADRPT